MSAAATERRESPRIELEIEVTAESAHNFYTGFGRNISDGGLFIATQALPFVGEELRVRFRLPGLDRAIQADGVVRWVREVGDPETHGVGVALAKLAKEDREVIDRFIAAREPIFYVAA
jgi:type IV pilus assembly protein PilZ